MSLHSHDEISWFCIKETSAQPSFCFCSLFAVTVYYFKQYLFVLFKLYSILCTCLLGWLHRIQCAPPPLFLGMGGQFADLKRGLAKKMGGGGVFEGAGDTTMHTMVYKGPQKTTTKTKNFSVIHDIFTRNCVIYFMWKICSNRQWNKMLLWMCLIIFHMGSFI